MAPPPRPPPQMEPSGRLARWGESPDAPPGCPACSPRPTARLARGGGVQPRLVVRPWGREGGVVGRRRARARGGLVLHRGPRSGRGWGRGSGATGRNGMASAGVSSGTASDRCIRWLRSNRLRGARIRTSGCDFAANAEVGEIGSAGSPLDLRSRCSPTRTVAHEARSLLTSFWSLGRSWPCIFPLGQPTAVPVTWHICGPCKGHSANRPREDRRRHRKKWERNFSRSSPQQWRQRSASLVLSTARTVWRPRGIDTQRVRPVVVITCYPMTERSPLLAWRISLRARPLATPLIDALREPIDPPRRTLPREHLSSDRCSCHIPGLCGPFPFELITHL